MINITTVLIIIFIHWVADFVFQDEKWALGKSKNWSDLLKHTLTYSIIWIFLSMCLFAEPCYISGLGYCVNTIKCFQFALITFLCHTITDYITSKIVSKRFENKYYGSAIPNFGAFTIIGIDQFLHYLQLFLTYKLLS